MAVSAGGAPVDELDARILALFETEPRVGVLEASRRLRVARGTVQARLDRSPEEMRLRRQTVEHPFGTIKSWMGSTHFQMKTLKHVGTEMALHVLAYN